MKKLLIALTFMLAGTFSTLAAEAPVLPKSFANLPEKHTSTEGLETIESTYTRVLCERVEAWPKGVSLKRTDVDRLDEPLVESECYDTPGNALYMGVGQRMVIAAPFERVVETVDDYAGYVGIMDGLVSVHSLAFDGNRVLTEWEQAIPVPFVPNEHNQLVHLVNQPRPGFKTYRYGLKKGTGLLKNDGVIVLEKKNATETIYTEYDFFDADWGIAKKLGTERLWKESIQGVFQSDLALKFRAEHSNWSETRIQSEARAGAKKLADRDDYCPKRPFALEMPRAKGKSKCR